MRILNTISYKQPSANFSFKQNKTIEHLSGLEIAKKYENIRNNNQKEEIENRKVNSILYYAIPVLEKNGLYRDAQILYDSLYNNVSVYEDPILNYTIGNIYQKNGELEQAYKHYDIAASNLSSVNDTDAYDIIKKYKSTYLLFNSYDTSIDPIFENKSEPGLNGLNMYLSSMVSSLKNNPQKAENEIKAAYKLMKNNNYEDVDVNLQTASIFAQEGEYEKSNDIILDNLNKLKEQKLVYTKEFINFLLLLGFNLYETSENQSLTPSTNIFKNAAELSKFTGLKETQEIAEYAIAKNLFLEKSEEFDEYAKNLLNTIENEQSKANLNEMLGDFNAGEDKDIAVKYYKNALTILENNDSDGKQIYELRKKIMEFEPVSNSDININSEEIAFYNTHDLLNTYQKLYGQKDYEQLRTLTKKALETRSSDINLSITKAFSSLANIRLGEDYPKNIKQIDEELNKCREELKKSPENTDLKGFVFYTYKIMARLFYEASDYSKAAYMMKNSFNYADEENFPKKDLIKNRIIAALMNYKAKDYLAAEENTLKYLELLLDKKFENTEPLKITQEINEILISKNISEKRKIASAYETLGLINLKAKNLKDSQEYFSNAVNIRERIMDKDIELANSYAALARLAIFNSRLFDTKRPNSSKELHNKCLEILKSKYPKESITEEEQAFHEKYYGVSVTSAGKYIKNQFLAPDQKLIDKFKCYNKELSICE